MAPDVTADAIALEAAKKARKKVVKKAEEAKHVVAMAGAKPFELYANLFADKARKPWRSIEEVELATLEWVWWFNNTRLHSELGYRTPNETENAYYDSQDARTPTRALANR